MSQTKALMETIEDAHEDRCVQIEDCCCVRVLGVWDPGFG